MASVTGKQVIDRAKLYIGEGSARFADAYGQDRAADWCCVFVWYVYQSLGASKLFYNGNKTAWVPNIWYFDRANLKRIPITEALPGDVIIFDINQNGEPDHIGFVTGRKSANQVYTIEGNTTGYDKHGNSSDSCVATKVRSSAVILGIFRPAYADTNAGIITINRKYKIVNAKGANMRRGAAMSYKKTGHIPNGTIIRGLKMFKDKKGNTWIWTNYGACGWIPIKYGKRIYLHIV